MFRTAWYIGRYMRNQWLKREELTLLSQKLLRQTISNAYYRVPFYHKMMDSIKVKPDDIKSSKDLAKLPMITKTEVQHNSNDFIAVGTRLNECKSARTSGSTGIPLTIFFDNIAESHRAAVFWRFQLTNGLRLTDKRAIIGDPRRAPRRQRFFEHLKLLRFKFISVLDSVETQVRILGEWRPDVIFGYSSSLLLIAKALKKQGSVFSPRLIFSECELLDDHTRRFINSVFGTEILDQYGSVEFQSLAWECNQHMGYHMDIDNCVIELIDKNGESVAPGETGEIVVTDLHNFTMPLIRYRIGDIGKVSEELCICGRGLPLMKVIEGRTNDLVLLPDGRTLSPIIWGTLLREYSGVECFRVVQEKLDIFKIYIKKSSEYHDETVSKIICDVKGMLGKSIQVKVEFVEEISREKSGKLRSFVSNIKSHQTHQSKCSI